MVINYDILEKHFEIIASRPWNAIVFDEAHYLKNHNHDTKLNYILVHNKHQLYLHNHHNRLYNNHKFDGKIPLPLDGRVSFLSDNEMKKVVSVLSP